MSSPIHHRLENKISSLPDEILENILSFVPTKSAVLTSTLAKRWTHIWKLVPFVDIDDGQENPHEIIDKTNFMRYADNVISHHNHSDLAKFTLSCFNCNPNRVDSWILTALKRRTQQMSIKIGGCEGPLSFPTPTESLTELSIEMECYDLCLLKGSISLLFPNLKYLCLNCITLRRDSFTPTVYFNFPTLENLLIKECDWHNIQSVEIRAVKLRTLSIINGSSALGCELEFYVDNLLSFNLESYQTCKCVIHNASSLLKVRINTDNALDIDRWPSDLSLGICHVQHLTLSDAMVQTLETGEDDLEYYCVFSKLTSLRVYCWVFMGCEELLSFLKRSPNLKSLDIMDVKNISNENDNWKFQSIPGCLLSSLKSVKLLFFHGNDDLCFAKYLLENAKALEKMVIVFSNMLGNNSKNGTVRVTFLYGSNLLGPMQFFFIMVPV